MDARRLELYELLKPKLDEAPARALVLALGPEPDQLVTKNDLAVTEERLVARMDLGFARMEARFAQIEARFPLMEATLTRRMIATMGAWTVLVGSTVGWVAIALR